MTYQKNYLNIFILIRLDKFFDKEVKFSIDNQER